MLRVWTAVSVIGLTLSILLLLLGVSAAGPFRRAVENIVVERVKFGLQAELGDESVSSLAARCYLESLPSGKGGVVVVDRDGLLTAVRRLGEHDVSLEPTRVALRNGSEGRGERTHSALDQRVADLMHEIRLAGGACVLLFGLASGFLARATFPTDVWATAAKISASGGSVIGVAQALRWSGLHALQGNGVPITVVATSVVLGLVGDLLFNEFRATRAAVKLILFWP